MGIVAAFDKVLFYNPASKYSVLRLKTADLMIPDEARSPYQYRDHLIRFVAVGYDLPQTEAIKMELTGVWEKGRYGCQLQVEQWHEIVPPTLEGIRGYLSSGLLKGIGEKTAEAIVQRFGVDSLNILENQPNRLLEIRGITEEKLEDIKAGYAESKMMRDLNVNDPRIKKWLGEVVGKEGEDLTRHDKWLCMMYPRLKLLQKLLSEDGAIFISIDDNEKDCLKLICNEIFGANLYMGTIVRSTGQTTGQDSAGLGSSFDYILVYAKSRDYVFGGLPLTAHDLKRFENVDARGNYAYDQLRKTGSNDRREDRPNMYYPIINPDGEELYPTATAGYDSCWRVEKKTYERLVAEDYILWKKTMRNGTEVWWPYVKYYAEGRTKRPSPLWNEIEGNKKASRDLKAIMGAGVKFDYPKPLEMIDRILQIASVSDGDIVLDSFAGSGTTAHAVLNANKADGGSRKFILIEMMDYADSITAERVKRVINGYGEGKNAVEGTGGNFSFYDLGEPLMIGECLNEQVAPEKIREYIWFMETKQPYAPADNGNRYYLGKHNNTGYYFFYEPQNVTVLDYAFLATITKKADGTVIYADRCAIGEDKLSQMGITFKKIPRDISRL